MCWDWVRLVAVRQARQGKEGMDGPVGYGVAGVVFQGADWLGGVAFGQVRRGR
jgi:hypothetical protein